MRNALSWHQMPTRGSGRVLPVSLVPAEGRMQIKKIKKKEGSCLSPRELRKKLLMLAPIAHSWVWQGIAPLVTDASFRQQINSCVWPSNQTHTIKVTTKIILSSAGPMSHACPVWPHPLPLAYYVILCIYVFIIYHLFIYYIFRVFRIFGCGGSSPS